jgi:transcriptional/translational regulatory protein YebC/TACO1
MNLEKENMELKEMLAGAQLTEKNLEDYLYEICDVIHMQLPLRYQDTFVEKMIELGLYDPEEGLEA